MKRIMRKFVQRIKHHFSEVLRIKRSSHEIALGFAIGTFIGIMPTPGLSMILALFVILIYERVSKISLFGGIILWNPILTFPLYPLSYRIGNTLLRDVPAIHSNFVIFNKIYEFSTRFLLGNLIVAVSISIMCYIIIRLIALFYQEKIKPKIELLEFKE